MNITVIFTGGTIGSSVQQEFVSTDAQMPYRLLAMYESEREVLQSQTSGHKPLIQHSVNIWMVPT